MWTRRGLVASLGSYAAAQGAWAQDALPQGPQLIPETPQFVIDASVDASTRMTVPVQVNGQGPFDFIVDTGADRTVISTDLAERLRLPPGPNLTVHSIAGAMTAPTRMISRLTLGGATLRDLTIPVLPRLHLAAAGLLGVDTLQGRSVVMDFARGELAVKPSIPHADRVRPKNETLVEAAKSFGRLTVLDARVDGVRTTVFLDSGAGISIGNLALAKAIRARLRDGSAELPVALESVTGQTVTGILRRTKAIGIGRVQITDLMMAFCDLHLFAMWGLSDKPTMLLGVDGMRTFSRVELDFRRRDVLFCVSANTSPTLGRL